MLNNDTDYYIVVMTCKLKDDIPGIIRKAVFLKDVEKYISEGWSFSTDYDKNIYDKLRAEK